MRPCVSLPAGIGPKRPCSPSPYPVRVQPARAPLAERRWDDKQGWVQQWQGAWDVEKVTDKFFKDYRTEFKQVEAAVRGVPEGEQRLLTQSLFNRLMFLAFLQKKLWLNRDANFLRNVYGTALGEVRVPFLNGGLFERREPWDSSPKATVPNDALGAVIELFERYNFTITESTPLDIEFAVDPEMLGRVFEELVTGRHETGSYYTPRNRWRSCAASR